MIRLYADRYKEFRKVYFDTAFALICKMGTRNNKTLNDQMFHFPHAEYRVARELVWLLCDYGLYSKLAGKGSDFADWKAEDADKIKDLKAEDLKSALRLLILGDVYTLRAARELLKNPQENFDDGGYSRDIWSIMERNSLGYDTEADKENKKAEYLLEIGSKSNLLPYIPYSAEKDVLKSLNKKDDIGNGQKEIRALLANRWAFLDYLIKNGYENLRDKQPGDEGSKWRQMKVSAWLVSLLGLRSCPYCNRNYIGTTGKKNLGYQLDHYINKSMYPFFCMSLFNLIPSCGVCNGGKSTGDEEDFYSPFEEEPDYDQDLDFTYIPPLFAEDGHGYVRISTDIDNPHYERYDATIKALGLNECYKFNKEEADDFIRKMIYYPQSMIRELGQTISGDSGNNVLAEQFVEVEMFGEGMVESDEYRKYPLSMMYRHLYRKYRK